jgi:hypothetical protein
LIVCRDDFQEAIENPLPFEQGCGLHDEFIRTFAHPPRVVCELGVDNDGKLTLFLHCFVSKAAFISYLRTTGATEADTDRFSAVSDETPVKAWLIVTSLDNAKLTLVPKAIAHEHWTWITTYEPKLDDNVRNFEILGRSGEVCAIPMPASLIRSRGATRSRSLRVSAMRISGTLFHQLGTQTLEYMPEELCLQEFATADVPDNVRVVRLVMAKSDGTQLAEPASFDANCLAATVYQGYYAQAYRILAERGI